MHHTINPALRLPTAPLTMERLRFLYLVLYFDMRQIAHMTGWPLREIREGAARWDLKRLGDVEMEWTRTFIQIVADKLNVTPSDRATINGIVSLLQDGRERVRDAMFDLTWRSIDLVADDLIDSVTLVAHAALPETIAKPAGLSANIAGVS